MTQSNTQTVERKMPIPGMHTAVISDVKYENKLPGYVDPATGVQGPPKDRITLFLELQGEENKDSEGMPIRTVHFINETTWIHFTKRGAANPTTYKTGKFLQTMFGTLPESLKFEEVDWDALKGCYLQGFINIVAKKDGSPFAKFEPFIPVQDAAHKEFNEQRKGMVFKGRK